MTLDTLVNLFLAEKRQRVDAQEMTASSWGEYSRACEMTTIEFGQKRDLLDLHPEDFSKLRRTLAAKYGPHSLRKYVTLIRALFTFAFENHHVDVPIRFGSVFEIPPQKAMRLARQQKGSRLLTPEQCRALIATADPQFKAMIYLGLNCGFGQTDCANLTRSMLAVQPGWIEAIRMKTATPRKCPLWDETTAALQAVERIRPATKIIANEDCVFLTVGGLRWVRYLDKENGKRGSNKDELSVWFKRLTIAAGVSATFYDLRHTFRTIADEVRDEPAINLIMGHAEQNMAAVYREMIAESRLKAITDHVRKWLT